MFETNLFAEPHEFLMEAKKSNGINLVFAEGITPNDYLIESVINWAKSPRTLGFTEDPYEVEFEEADFGEGIAVYIKWGQDIDVVPYEVINLTAGFLETKYPHSGCEEIQVSISNNADVVVH